MDFPIRHTRKVSSKLSNLFTVTAVMVLSLRNKNIFKDLSTEEMTAIILDRQIKKGTYK